MHLRVGEKYDRDQIHKQLGGGVRDYLPHRNGEVVCGCFRPDANPEAPKIVLPGTGQQIEHWAGVFAAQDNFVPVFIRRGPNAWEYMGDFRVRRMTQEPFEIQSYARRAGRSDITSILRLEERSTLRSNHGIHATVAKARRRVMDGSLRRSPNAVTMPRFHFDDFARDVYVENPNAHREPFLLPALYGGEVDRTYDAAFVLQEPSVSFTQNRWRPCATPVEAVRMHRQIFVEWAYRGKAAILFGGIDDATRRERALQEPTTDSFFSRYYVTDIWKDARRTDRDRKYWLAKLADELSNVSTRRVIFVGQEALQGRHLVPNGLPTHDVPFPSQWIGRAAFALEVDRLVQKIRADEG